MRKKRLLHGLWFNLQARPTELFQKTNPCKITDGPQQLGREYTVKLEEYLRKRKKEDGVNEYDSKKREENEQICVKYVLEYFNSYLNTTEEEKKAAAHEKQKEKYAGWVKDYSDDIRKWLIDIKRRRRRGKQLYL